MFDSQGNFLFHSQDWRKRKNASKAGMPAEARKNSLSGSRTGMPTNLGNKGNVNRDSNSGKATAESERKKGLAANERKKHATSNSATASEQMKRGKAAVSKVVKDTRKPGNHDASGTVSV